MLGKCVNPYCAAAFHRLREGRLLVVDPNRPRYSRPGGMEPEGQRKARGPRYYWLCQKCSQVMNLVWENGTLALILKHRKEN